MNCRPFSGFLRLLCPALCLWPLCLPGTGQAASLHWEALPDRERIVIRMDPTEGMPGSVARITPTGVLIPFNEVPQGLRLENTPQGAKIFKGTNVLGRSVALLTQTPEFGFVVGRQTSTELVVDFFPDKLGARWAPTSLAPTTEIPPDFAVPDYGGGSPTGQIGPASAQPAGTAALSAAPAAGPRRTGPPVTITPDGAPVAAPNTSLATTAPAQPAAPSSSAPPTQQAAQAAAPVPSAPPAAPTTAPSMPEAAQVPRPADTANGTAPRRSMVPVVITPDGTPLTGPAARPDGSRPPDIQPRLQPPNVSLPGMPTPQQTDAAETAPHPTLQNRNGTPLLDIRPETADRNAPLPQPMPTVHGPDAQVAPADVSQPPTVPATAATPPATMPTRPVPQNAQADAAAQTVSRAVPAQAAAAQPSATVETPQAAPAQQTAEARDLPRAARSPQSTRVPVIIPGVGVPSPKGASSKGRVHLGPLEDIQAPLVDSAVVVPLLHPDAAATAPAGDAEGQAAVPPTGQNATAGPQKIYVDEEGNPVEAPPDPAALLIETRADIAARRYADALAKAEKLLPLGLTDAQREEALHLRADMTFALNKGDLQGHFQEIVNTTQQAIAFNQQSRRNAVGLLRMGYVNLKVNNTPEAEAWFNRLRALYPDDENVPVTYYYWGDYYYSRNELQKASDQFQYILQKYPDSRYAREAALGLARTHYRLGYYEQSFNVVDYIEKRWPRFYLDYPPFLNMMGDTAFRLNKLDTALKEYRLYVNLEPDGPEADVIYTRIGDIYSLSKEKGAAKEMYMLAARRFPDKDGGLVAKMRLAEEGINDDPSISGMFSVFDQGFSLAPQDVYQEIITKYPNSALVPLALLKLAMWDLWNKRYMETLQACNDFMQKYPKHELAPKVQETALKTFAALAAQGREQGTYSQMHEAWERFPIVRNKEEMLSPESRLALAVSYWNNHQPQEALSVVEPFFLGSKVSGVSESALQLVLSIYLEYEQWAAVREVGRRVELWELSPEVKQQLDYALALASENLGEPDAAAPVWRRLYESGTLSPTQMSYAAFFLARDAERKRNLEDAYILGNEALNRLLEEARRTPARADLGKLKSQLGSLMDISEAAGRLREAQEYAQNYLGYLPENDPERVGVLYRVARIYRKQGNIESWKKGLSDLAAKYPDTVYGRTAASELQDAAILNDAADYSPTGNL